MRPNPLPPANIDDSGRSLPILYPGSCEPLKAAFHAAALGLAAVMGAYNAAAWLQRRQSHLALNAVIYFAAAFWEQRHVTHHLFPCLPSQAAPELAAPDIQDMKGVERADEQKAA
jgi:hypothetical protein